jgi:excisionase family DNA binding protein
VPDDWISIAEAAEILAVSPMTVRRRVDDGEIEGYRTKPPSKGWRRVSRASVEAYKARMQPPASTPPAES